jgi:hypothetical protein
MGLQKSGKVLANVINEGQVEESQFGNHTSLIPFDLISLTIWVILGKNNSS